MKRPRESLRNLRAGDKAVYLWRRGRKAFSRTIVTIVRVTARQIHTETGVFDRITGWPLFSIPKGAVCRLEVPRIKATRSLARGIVDKMFREGRRNAAVFLRGLPISTLYELALLFGVR